MRTDDLTIAPLGAEHWDDLETLFGPQRGAYSRCWCMWWRVSGREFEAMGGDGRKAATLSVVVSEVREYTHNSHHHGLNAARWCDFSGVVHLVRGWCTYSEGGAPTPGW